MYARKVVVASEARCTNATVSEHRCRLLRLHHSHHITLLLSLAGISRSLDIHIPGPLLTLRGVNQLLNLGILIHHLLVLVRIDSLLLLHKETRIVRKTALLLCSRCATSSWLSNSHRVVSLVLGLN